MAGVWVCVCQFFSELERSVDATGGSGLLLPGLFGEEELSVCSSAGTWLLLLWKAADEAVSQSAPEGSVPGSRSSFSQGHTREDHEGTLPARASPCWGCFLAHRCFGGVWPGAGRHWGCNTPLSQPSLLSGSHSLSVTTNQWWKGETHRGTSGRC